MTTRAERLAAEVAHGRLLLDRYPAIWSWSTPAGRRRAARRVAELVEAGGFRAGQRLLELGCGTGNFTAWVAAASGARVLGVEVSPELVAEARRRSPGLEFEVADAHALPYPAASFDGAFGSSVLHHLELDPALAELWRVIKPGARIAFAEPNLANPQVFAQRIPVLRRRALDLPHETAFLRGPLAARLRRAGFVDVRIEPFDFLHPLTPAPLIEIVDRVGAWSERIPGIRELAGSCLIRADRAA